MVKNTYVTLDGYREYRLERCPFCNGLPTLKMSLIGGTFFVRCKRKRCCGMGPRRATRQGAIFAWNKRAGWKLMAKEAEKEKVNA